jgi:hypothetical protein
MNKDQFLKEVLKYDPDGVSLREIKDWLLGLTMLYKMPAKQKEHQIDIEHNKHRVLDVWYFAFDIADSGHWKGKKYGYFDQ